MKTGLLLSLLLVQTPGRIEFGAVNGQIRANDGSPAVAVRVAAMAVEENGAVIPGASTLVSLSQTDNEGRYQLENVPPGRYLIIAGYLDFPIYYPGVRAPGEAERITIAAGQTSAGINFTLITVRVRGRVENLKHFGSPGLLRVVLSPLRSGMRAVESALYPGGEFEFTNVTPGTYSLRLTPGVGGTVPIEVDDKDIEGIKLAGTPTIFGRVSVDDGSPLPVQEGAIAAGIADPPSLVRLKAFRPNFFGVFGTAIVPRDGMFALPFAATAEEGEYEVVASLIPIGYYVKSITYGTLDLLRAPLTLARELSSNELQVVLTKTPPANQSGGVKISGRVTGPEYKGPGVPLIVTIQSTAPGNQAAATQETVTRMGEAKVREDGSFEIDGVPPGRYSLMTVAANYSAAALSLDVAGSDVSGVELDLRESVYIRSRITFSSTVPPPPPAPR